jgi:hypothetical protein
LTLEKPIQTKELTYLWCNDGWCYIPEIKARRKYFTIEDNLHIQIIEEKWSELIPVCEYLEKVEVSIYSHSPQIWKEQIENFCDLYVESKEIQTTNRKKHAHRQSLQN